MRCVLGRSAGNLRREHECLGDDHDPREARIGLSLPTLHATAVMPLMLNPKPDSVPAVNVVSVAGTMAAHYRAPPKIGHSRL